MWELMSILTPEYWNFTANYILTNTEVHFDTDLDLY